MIRKYNEASIGNSVRFYDEALWRLMKLNGKI